MREFNKGGLTQRHRT